MIFGIPINISPKDLLLLYFCLIKLRAYEIFKIHHIIFNG